MPAKSI